MSGRSVAPFFPWRRVKVAYQSVSQGSRRALFRLEPNLRHRPCCHACGHPARTVHSATRKFVRDLCLADFSVLLHIEHRKVWCDSCGGVRVELLEFVDVHQRITHRLAAYATQLCQAGLSLAAVASHLDLDPKTVKAIDMWEAYVSAVKKWCPQADIVFDLFHVIKRFNKVIDDIRNQEFRQAHASERDLLKDLLAHLWTYHRADWARAVLDQWCAVARQDGHPALVRFARGLQKYAYGILSHCRHPMHTGRLEGINNKIKVIKRVAYGFHDLQYFARKVKQAFPGDLVSN